MTDRPEPQDWPPPGWEALPWRVGRQVGRAVILQVGDQPDEHDPTVGQLDTSELGRLVVDAVNHYRACPLAHPAPGWPTEWSLVSDRSGGYPGAGASGRLDDADPTARG